MNPIALELHRLAHRLDTSQPLDQAIVDLLKAGAMSANDIALVVRKRRCDVRSAIRALAAGQLCRFIEASKSGTFSN